MRVAERATLLRVPHGRFHGALRQAHRLRRDADAPAVERSERDPQALPFLAEAIFCGHAAIFEHNFRRTRKPQSHLCLRAGSRENPETTVRRETP